MIISFCLLVGRDNKGNRIKKHGQNGERENNYKHDYRQNEERNDINKTSPSSLIHQISQRKFKETEKEGMIERSA